MAALSSRANSRSEILKLNLRSLFLLCPKSRWNWISARRRKQDRLELEDYAFVGIMSIFLTAGVAVLAFFSVLGGIVVLNVLHQLVSDSRLNPSRS